MKIAALLKSAPAAGALSLLLFLTILFAGANAQSLYVVADINSAPTPIRSYDVQGPPNYLVFQATQNVPRFGGGAVGLAIGKNDSVKSTLFVTYEISNTIQLLNATNFADLGTTTAPGARDLAGIVVDQNRKQVYTIDRGTNNLYVYSWNTTTNALTLVGGAPVKLTGVTQAHGLALDDQRDRLYVGDASTTKVRFFNASALTTNPVPEIGSVELAAEAQTVQGIAIDSVRNFLYTGNSTSIFGSKGKLVKFDLTTSAISSYTLPGFPNDNIVGITVDERTGNVYATTGNQAFGGTDTLIVFDSNLRILKNDIGDIGDPTGLVIEDVSFNPLNLSKTDNADPVAAGGTLTYKICYDNAANILPVRNVTIVDQLPIDTTFVSATGGGIFDSMNKTVIWNEGMVSAGAPQVCRDLTVVVTAQPGATILNRATIDSDDTPPTTRSETTVVVQGGICFSACFRSPVFYWLNLERIGARIGNRDAAVIIGGVNYNQPVSVAGSLGLVKFVLQGSSAFPTLPPPTPLARLNQEFLAAQISLALAGDDGSAEAFSVRNGQLRCYSSLKNFTPVTLSNGVTLTPFSKLGDLFDQALFAIRGNKAADMDALVVLFDLLNGNDPSGNCH